MLDEATIERRLITLEQTVGELQQKVNSKPINESWLQKLTGSISDEAVFLEALEYGQNFRQSDRPIDESAK
jgi:glycine cleavage system H lipoate-binding protein